MTFRIIQLRRRGDQRADGAARLRSFAAPSAKIDQPETFADKYAVIPAQAGMTAYLIQIPDIAIESLLDSVRYCIEDAGNHYQPMI